MARSRSPTTAVSHSRSPTRRAPSRTLSNPSTESHYEIDLSALGGPESTALDSTGLNADGEGRIDVVRSDEIEGPEDFTVNMEFWMRAPLPLKADVKVDETERVEEGQYGEVGISEGSRDGVDESGEQDELFGSRSPTMRAPETGDEGGDGDDDGEDEGERVTLDGSSMENQEKVMSYLDALPDTDVAEAAVSTPGQAYKGSTVKEHIPSPLVVQRTRELRPTVEDYADTPRKVTQETVIHNAPGQAETQTEEGLLRERIAALEARLQEQDQVSKRRVMELETLLSFARSELETAREQAYKKTEEVAKLTESNQELQITIQRSRAEYDAKLNELKEDFHVRMREFGEELRLQNAARLERQSVEFEGQIEAVKHAGELVANELAARDRRIVQLQSDLMQEKEQAERNLNTAMEQCKAEFDQEKQAMNDKISALETRTQSLNAELEKAMNDAKAARMEAQNQSTSQESPESYRAKITELESHIQTLQTHLDSSRADAADKDLTILRGIDEHERLDQQFTLSQSRVSDLETSITALRQQLAQARDEVAEAFAESQRAHEGTRLVREGLREVRADADSRVKGLEAKVRELEEARVEAERRVAEVENQREDLTEQHEIRVEEMRTKAEDAVRKVGAMLEQERAEKKKATKEIKGLKADLEQLRADAATKHAETRDENDEEQEKEVEKLRSLLRKQVAATKAAKAESHNLHTELETLRAQFEAQRQDFEAVNSDMDDRLAALLRTVVKDRAKTVMETRDEQWGESVERLKGDRDFMGRVLMREWGRQEVGGAREGERQGYAYRYVKR
ncbi:hypothetical protein K432DRAFT_297332 [Lepidopterella palustris CBS 459.81]|uniref:Uncharacterized protein n=1 Tax=Lepidopterella palustris CBS 459.81 TaxID=1314670 RepID=A0A8E2EAU8_9PEZI|nr:hypothetical protein K432DRAFT_297332 [Lepidopterella palustris CBS 459.81]